MQIKTYQSDDKVDAIEDLQTFPSNITYEKLRSDETYYVVQRSTLSDEMYVNEPQNLIEV